MPTHNTLIFIYSQVLNNLESYLVEEEVRMRKLDEKCEFC